MRLFKLRLQRLDLRVFRRFLIEEPATVLMPERPEYFLDNLGRVDTVFLQHAIGKRILDAIDTSQQIVYLLCRAGRVHADIDR